MKRRLGLILVFLLLCLPHIGLAKGTGYIFVSSEKDHVVTVFKPGSLRIYVACGDDDAIDVIDVEKLKVVKSIAIGDDPDRFDLSPDDKFIYASNEDEGMLTIYDLAQEKTVAEIPVGEEPEGVLAHPDNKTIYVASEVANMIHVIDGLSRKLVHNIVVGLRPRRMAMTPDFRTLWVTNELSGTVSIIDTQAHQVTGEVTFRPKGFRPEDVTPVGICMTGDGKRAYVTLGHANHFAVVDVASRRVKDYVLVGKRAWGVALSPDERTLYVVNGKSDDMSVIDTKRLKVMRSVPAGRVPHDVIVDYPVTRRGRKPGT
jgi:PQQ-dependent catabolism-associated beta-propeller protein